MNNNNNNNNNDEKTYRKKKTDTDTAQDSTQPQTCRTQKRLWI